MLGLVPSYAALCAAQAGVVAAPVRREPSGRLRWLGILLPALALGVGVALIRRGAPAAVALWLVAWLAHGLVAEAAGIALIALAALRIASVASAIAPGWSIELGLVALVILDVVLVWGTPQVGPASTALHGVTLPSAAGHPIPALQDATFGSATMGWLDLLAPALLGVVARRRMRAAAVTGVAAGAWGLLLTVAPTVPATVPVLAGLLAARL